MQFNNIFVAKDMCSLDLLAVVDSGAPFSCGFQAFGHVAMDVCCKPVRLEGKTEEEWAQPARLF